MKVGDLVGHKRSATPTGDDVEMVQKKVWRTNIQGKRVNWDHVDPEAHAVVLLADKFITIPVIDLEVCNESG